MRQGINYLIFGVLTSLINYISFYIFYDKVFGHGQALVANLLSFILATAFAFVTNKVFVFDEKNWQPRTVVRQALSFFYHRLLSFSLEHLGLFGATRIFTQGKIIFSLGTLEFDGVMISKIILSIVATLLNYIFAKYIVFKKKEAKT